MEAHERWSYDEITYTQKLVRIIALCQQCHQTTHIGLAQIKGNGHEAKQHLKKIRDLQMKNVNCIFKKHLAYGMTEINMYGI